MKKQYLIAAAWAALAFGTAAPAFAHGNEVHQGDETVTPSFDQAIPDVPGKSLRARIVDYPPGGASVSHVHAKSAFIYAYVVSGQIESKVNDEPARIYKPGESWHEPPASLHSISRNVSKTEPARLLAVFVVDTDDTELTTPEGASK